MNAHRPSPALTFSSLALTAALLSWPIGCGSGDGQDTPAEQTPTPPDYSEPGKFTVGNVTVTLTDAARDRTLRVEIWYPALAPVTASAAQSEPVQNFAEAGAMRDQLAVALAASPTQCTSRQTASSRDAEPAAGGKWPLLAFSHCHLCARFSSFSLAEHLASHGFAVVAPDHTGGTLFDKLAGKNEGLTAAFLATRVGDIRFVLDVLLGDGAGLPDNLKGRFDATRVGAFGHSFGSVTTGSVLETDDRVRAGAHLYAPVESPLMPGVKVAGIAEPMLMFVATEDNSITEFGNKLIRDNFAAASPPVWKVEMIDAGHLSISDLCGLADGFKPGCGDGTRQTEPGVAFTYLSVTRARDIARVWLGNYFGRFLRDEAEAKAWLAAPPADADAKVEMRLE